MHSEGESLTSPVSRPGPKGVPPMAYFYEIRNADNAVLKRTSGFPDREAATELARADAKNFGVPSP